MHKKDNNNNSNSEAVCYYIMFSFLHWNSQHPLYDIVLISQKQMQVKSTIIQKQAIFRRRVVMYIVQTICSYILKCGCSDSYNILSSIQYMRSTVFISSFLEHILYLLNFHNSPLLLSFFCNKTKTIIQLLEKTQQRRFVLPLYGTSVIK